MKKIALIFLINILLSTYFLLAENVVVNSADLYYLKISAKEKRKNLRDKFLQKIKHTRLGLSFFDGKNNYAFSYMDNGDFPIYKVTENLNAAKTLSTNKVWNKSQNNYMLSGNEIKIGIWDSGAVRNTHQEFHNNVFIEDLNNDGEIVFSDHATHVAGTIAAIGVNSLSSGMAENVEILSYNWDNDEEEMIEEATSGLLLSNHSYGNITGWYFNESDDMWYWYGDTRVNNFQDYKFGFYSDEARAWDDLAYHASYYLIVKSAGNDRNDFAPGNGTVHYIWDFSNQDWILTYTNHSDDGDAYGYDTLTSKGTAKNILTVGAVDDIPNGYHSTKDVEMSPFSNWGPTDDGRIKPDICANGMALVSSVATSDSSYATYWGTSMSSPNVTGSLALLQEYFYQKNQKYMKAATLKALVIDTADEAGNDEGT